MTMSNWRQSPSTFSPTGWKIPNLSGLSSHFQKRWFLYFLSVLKFENASTPALNSRLERERWKERLDTNRTHFAAIQTATIQKDAVDDVGGSCSLNCRRISQHGVLTTTTATTSSLIHCSHWCHSSWQSITSIYMHLYSTYHKKAVTAAQNNNKFTLIRWCCYNAVIYNPDSAEPKRSLSASKGSASGQ